MLQYFCFVACFCIRIFMLIDFLPSRIPVPNVPSKCKPKHFWNAKLLPKAHQQSPGLIFEMLRYSRKSKSRLFCKSKDKFFEGLENLTDVFQFTYNNYQAFFFDSFSVIVSTGVSANCWQPANSSKNWTKNWKFRKWQWQRRARRARNC